jgi:hypothetical protein
MQAAPAAQEKVQFWSKHSKLHVESGPQLHEPFWHCPSHASLSPSHSTWQGPVSQLKAQLEPCSQWHSPFAQTPSHSLPSQSTWHGGDAQPNSQLDPGPHSQSPLAQSPMQAGLSPSQAT